MPKGSANRPDDLEYHADVKSLPLTPIFLKIKKPLDIIYVLHMYTLKINMGLMILSAFGTVRDVVLPLTSKNTYNEGVYQIMSLSGRLVPPKTGGIAGDLNLVMSDVNGATVGGMVTSLIAETTVEVILSPFAYDRSVSKPFEFDPPTIIGNPFLPSSSSDTNSDDSSSNELDP